MTNHGLYISETDSNSLHYLRRQLVAAVEMEKYVWSDEWREPVHRSLSEKVHRSVIRRLWEYKEPLNVPIANRHKWNRRHLKGHLLNSINKISHDLLVSARGTFAFISSAPVQFLISVSNDYENPEWERFGFDEFPFITWHAEALDAALRLRGFKPRLQLEAVKFLKSEAEQRTIEESMAMAEQDAGNDEFVALLKRAESDAQKRIRDHVGKLSKELWQAAEDFYGHIGYGTATPYAVPIEIELHAASDDLQFLGKAIREFGSAICIPFHVKIEGAATDQQAALLSMAKYNDIGNAFKALAAWVMALGLLENQRQCSICYRHASTKIRCEIHSTTWKETREARIGKKIATNYLRRRDTLIQTPGIRAALRTVLYWDDEAPTSEFSKRIRAYKLSKESTRRATILANQLRQIYPILSHLMADLVAQLFEQLLSTVSSIESLPKPNGEMQRREHARRIGMVKDLLALKGFFRAWCMKGTYSPEVPMRVLGLDRDNPICKGSALDSVGMRYFLLSQRAWEEEMNEYLSASMPTADQIRERLVNSNMKSVASHFGVGLSTAYRLLKNSEGWRRRNHFKRRA